MRLKKRLLGTFSGKRIMLDIILIPLTVYAVLCIYAWLVADRQMFLPPASSYAEHDDLITIKTTDGESLKALHLVNPEAKLTLLYSHGNAEDLGDVQVGLQHVRDLGFSVLAYDYRGYGLSTGKPSSAGVCRDIDAVYAYLTDTVGLRPEEVVAYGRSVGAGPSVHLAAQQPLGGLVLQSAFTSAFVVVTRIPLLPFDKFRNLKLIPHVACPLLIMHGKADRIVPFRHGRKLYAAANQPKQHLWLEDTGHNRFPGDHQERYLQALSTFRDLVLAHTARNEP